jgi:excisionase family DNA binding protein
VEISELGEIFTCAEVARVLQVTPGYVRHLARSGSLRALKTQSGQNIFIKTDVERMKQKRSQSIASAD